MDENKNIHKIGDGLTDERIKEIAHDIAGKMFEATRRKELRDFKGTPMKLKFAISEIKRYFNLGVSKEDIACLVASWGLTSEDLESANNYIHELSKTKKVNEKPQEGIIL